MENQEIQTEEIKKETPKEVSTIPVDQNGMVIARNNVELIRYCKGSIDSGMVPTWFNTPQKLFGALMFVRALKLPDISIRQTCNIHGVPTIFGDLPLALVQASGELTGFKEYWFDKNYERICFENKNLTNEIWGAVCLVKRGNDDFESFSFTLDDAEKAGLYPPKKHDGSIATSSPWFKYTRIMLRYKARALAMKSKFADKINGVSIAEYDFDVLPDKMSDGEIKDVTPRNAVQEMRDALKGEQSETKSEGLLS